MRLILLIMPAMFVGAALTAKPASAETEFAWCAVSGFGAGQDCSFTTLAQCQAATRGVGTDCERNPRFKGPAAAPPPQPGRSGTKS